jgi:hypothetical protein
LVTHYNFGKASIINYLLKIKIKVSFKWKRYYQKTIRWDGMSLFYLNQGSVFDVWWSYNIVKILEKFCHPFEFHTRLM